MPRRSTSYTVLRERRQGVGQVALYTEPRQRWTGRLALLLIIAVGLVLAASVPLGPRVSLPGFSASAPTPPRISHLAATGIRQGGGVEPGSRVALSWRASRAADRYRVRIALVRVGGPETDRPGRVERATRRTSLSFLPWASGLYQWRVQAAIGNKWGPYSPVAAFNVLPAIGRPVPLLPRNGSHLAAPVRLCWSEVKGASGYELWIAGRSPLAVGRTCVQLGLNPGSHVWRVAAFVHDTHSFTGRYSAVARFKIVGRTARLPVSSRKPASRTSSASASHASAPAPQAPATQPVAPSASTPSQVSRPAPVPAAPAPPVPASAPQPAAPPLAPAAPAQPAPATKKPAGCIPMFTC